MHIEGEHVDTRKVRRIIAWIRAEFAAGARRQAKPGTARLVLIDAEKLAADPKQPTLEEFARERGREDFPRPSKLRNMRPSTAALAGTRLAVSTW